MIAACFFIAAAGAAACAALPADFGPRGVNPEKLADRTADELQIMKWSAEATVVKIAHNAHVLAIAKRWFWTAYILACAGIVVPAAFIAWVYCSS